MTRNNPLDNPNFKKWFGNSVIKDENGIPIPMYHGTKEKNLTKFDRSTFQRNEPLRGGEGFYFTDGKHYAVGYAIDHSEPYDPNAHLTPEVNKRVGEYYIKLENPAPRVMVDDWKNIIKEKEEEFYYKLNARGNKDFVFTDELRKKAYDIVRHWSKKMREFLESNGYDGYCPVGQIPHNMAEIVVFNPEQIKSTSNVGTFDPTSHEFLKESIEKIGDDPSESYSDMPINWEESDVQILDKWNENNIRKYAGLPSTFIAIYRAIVNVCDLDPHLVEDDPDVEDEKTGFDWEEFRHTKRGFPPVLLMREEDGKVKIMDGNHRVYWAEQRGYRTIGAWVVDKLIQKDINRRTQRLTETRIITPEESIYEGYITLYHGTIWPIALKAKKGELGPQNLEKLITDVLINVFHETPKDAKIIFDREMKSHSIRQVPNKNLLFLTTRKESAEGYARSSTKFGGEIFLDVLGGYLWEKDKSQDYSELVRKYLQTDEPAVVTVNVPLSMVLTHPHWVTPLKDRLRDIIKNVKKNPLLISTLNDFRMEVFVKENIPARFVQRIDKVSV